VSYVRGPLPSHWHSIDTISAGLVAPQGQFSTATAWPTADLAVYTPLIVRHRVVVKQLWYANAATATGNYDIGLYDAAGAALLRKGSTAKGTSLEETVWNCTDTTIGPGLYFLALASDSGTDTFYAVTLAAPYPAALGMYSGSSEFPLPATATFSVPQTLGAAFLVGMFLDTRVS
jgi:hypothetical protein